MSSSASNTIVTLPAAIAALRDALRGHLARTRGEAAVSASALTPPPTLERVATLFGLSPFERDTLLLCAAAELDGAVAALIAEAQGDPAARQPSFSLALAALAGAHWSALTPAAPLRYWRLLEPGLGAGLALSPLRLDEQILHYLAGSPQPHPRLSTLAEPLPQVAATSRLSASAQPVAAAWSAQHTPLVQITGTDHASRRAVAAEAATATGRTLWWMSAALLPDQPEAVTELARLWSRQLLLLDGALLLECDLREQDSLSAALLARFSQQLSGPLALSGDTAQPSLSRPSLQIELRPPPAAEQHRLWVEALGPTASLLNGAVDQMAAQFHLNPAQIQAASADLNQDETTDVPLPARLWQAARTQARPHLDHLAQRIEPTMRWADLALPEDACATLGTIIAAVRGRFTVYTRWGFAHRSGRGLGVSALFAGPSGTGKTSAAELIAAELGLDLYRIDLSQVVSKYVGETEKHLRQLFAAAETGGAILLFDEADALFGKRSEVRDSHDRYANLEVSYLLQRIESYSGLAILTTNMRQALDSAFLRRIRFMVPFPFPGAAQREQIWRRAFPPHASIEGLDYLKLARLNVAGGNIYGIALNAACLAAAEDCAISMDHLRRAARAELAKLEKPLGEAEFADWI